METKSVLRHQGRPIGSSVRQNIVEILYQYKQLHGYELYKIYVDIFPKVSMRLIYYHLKKGLSLNEFKVQRIEKKVGKYSWGGSSENIIYALGKDARPVGNEQVRKYKQSKS